MLAYAMRLSAISFYLDAIRIDTVFTGVRLNIVRAIEAHLYRTSFLPCRVNELAEPLAVFASKYVQSKRIVGQATEIFLKKDWLT